MFKKKKFDMLIRYPSVEWHELKKIRTEYMYLGVVPLREHI